MDMDVEMKREYRRPAERPPEDRSRLISSYPPSSEVYGSTSGVIQGPALSPEEPRRNHDFHLICHPPRPPPNHARRLGETQNSIAIIMELRPGRESETNQISTKVSITHYYCLHDDFMLVMIVTPLQSNAASLFRHPPSFRYITFPRTLPPAGPPLHPNESVTCPWYQTTRSSMLLECPFRAPTSPTLPGLGRHHWRKRS
nr:hypothetical protein CFP56_57880 [Quercus suber]